MRKKQTSEINEGLTETQHSAIRLLVSGCTAKYTALVLKLDYANVRQWIKRDAQFQKELALQAEQQANQLSDQTDQPHNNSRPSVKRSGINTRAGKSRGRSLPD